MFTARRVVLAATAVAITAACASQAASDVPAAAECTLTVASVEEANDAAPGDVVCFPEDGDLSDERLEITASGTPEFPITYHGRGAAVDGITVDADHVILDDFTVNEPEAPGVYLEGAGNTLRDTTITNPRGGDGDGIRFFGDDTRILGNTVTGTDNSTGAHADCMQTYASGSPPSRNVRIEGNRCEDIDNMCLMAEGPNDGEGDGEGTTADFLVKDNYCETLDASQALMFEDVRNVTITGNDFAAATHHAIGLAIGSTGAHVLDDNAYHPDIRCRVGVDESSLRGYEGPEPRCAP